MNRSIMFSSTSVIVFEPKTILLFCQFGIFKVFYFLYFHITNKIKIACEYICSRDISLKMARVDKRFPNFSHSSRGHHHLSARSILFLNLFTRWLFASRGWITCVMWFHLQITWRKWCQKCVSVAVLRNVGIFMRPKIHLIQKQNSFLQHFHLIYFRNYNLCKFDG